MKNFISLGITGIGLALMLSGAQAMANEGANVSKPWAAFHTLTMMPTDENTAPVLMTDEQLNAVEGKQNLFIENLRQEILEILASTQALLNQQLPQLPQAESLRQEILISTQEIVNQGLSQFQNLPRAASLRQEILTSTQEIVNQGLSQLP